MNILKNFHRYRMYFVLEPFIFCYTVTTCFLVVGIQNLGLEKVCRFSLKIDKYICDNVIDKTISGIECDEVLNNEFEPQVEGIIKKAAVINNLTLGSYDFNQTVCKLEVLTQSNVTFINGIRGPVVAVFILIIVLFAGGWSDRKGVKKPCMLFPMIGYFLATSALLISSIFMEAIPMEFGNIIEKLLPAMFGGHALMVMGIYGYLAAVTPEKDRVFRFGMYKTFVNIFHLIGSPLAGIFYKNLGYINLFILGDVVLFVGIFYLIFFVKEVETSGLKINETKKNTIENGQGQDNYAFETTARDDFDIAEKSINISKPMQNRIDSVNITEPAKEKNCFVEFFDLTSLYDGIRVFRKKRDNNKRMHLTILILAFFMFLGPTLAEPEYLLLYVRRKLKWDDNQFSFYNTYSTAIGTIGTFIIITVFSNILKMSDSMLGLLSSVCSLISRPMFAFAKESIIYYAGGTIDMFSNANTVTIRAIISTLVGKEEFGRLYSFLALSDALGGFIFPPIYSFIYTKTLNDFPGAFYLFTDICLIPNALIFVVIYFSLNETNYDNNGKMEQVKTAGMDDSTNRDEFQITHM